MAEKLRSLWKKCPKWGKIAGAVVLAMAVSAAVAWYCNSPLDRILLYEVEAVPREDGTLDITYHLQWKVLNDMREGPLREVRIGLANNRCTLTGAGGDILTSRDPGRMSGQGTIFVWDDGAKPSEPDFKWGLDYTVENPLLEGWLIVFQLNRDFHKGECADFWFTVNQRDMLCEEYGQLFYDFTPGWFSEIEVEQYRFTWKNSPQIQSSNEDRSEGEWLVWEGSLGENDHRTMKVYYEDQAFAGAEPVKWKATNFYQSSNSKSRLENCISSALQIFLVIIFVVIRVLLPGGYRRGRGYGGHHGGSGGGCACACAGCACACACAGGGRAGCSRKDFTSSRRPDR